ncbi:hypothetical protein [Bacteroides hominis]|uniref:hypothetical protein n=1 Tax=Bacteroides hominis TaxID=2763023 RepID=UPI00300F9C25
MINLPYLDEIQRSGSLLLRNGSMWRSSQFKRHIALIGYSWLTGDKRLTGKTQQTKQT